MLKNFIFFIFIFYGFTPTQIHTIRNGEWHLLIVSYAANKDDLSFYYDGQSIM